MIHRNQALKVLGLSALAIAGLMAFMAAGAQAVWLESGAAIGANKLVEADMHTEGLLDVPAINLIIHCATLTGDDFLLVAGTNLAQGKMLLSNCKVLQNGILNTACDKHLNAKGEVEGLLEPIVFDFKVKIVEAAGKALLLFEPLEAGSNFAVFEFHESCALPLKNNAKGLLLAECLKSSDLAATNCLNEETIHLLKQVEVSTHKLTYGVFEAKLLGITKVKLATGNPWCGHV